MHGATGEQERPASAPDSPAVEELIQALRTAYPIAHRELQRLTPGPGASEAGRPVGPTPTTRLTIAVAGACLSRPGIHYVHFYSREMDIRPELHRMALDLVASEPTTRLHVLTRRIRALRAAALAIPLDEGARQRFELLSATEHLDQLQPDPTACGVLLLDLEHLSLDASYAPILRFRGAAQPNRVLLFGNRDHRILKPFMERFTQDKDCVAWGVNRQQIVQVDAAHNREALQGIRASVASVGSHDVRFDPANLPERFHDVKVREIIPPQFRLSPSIRGRFWAAIAGHYAIRDAQRRASQSRRLLLVDESPPQAVLEAREELLVLSQQLRGRRDTPYAVARAVDDLWYLHHLTTRTTAPVPYYVRQLSNRGFEAFPTPVDTLQAIVTMSESMTGYDGGLLTRVRFAAQRLVQGYNSLHEQNGTVAGRHAALLEVIQKAHENKRRLVIVALNRPDKEATRRFLAEKAPRGVPSATIQVAEPQGLRPELPRDEAIFLRPPSPTHLDSVAVAAIPAVVCIVPRTDEAYVAYRLFRDLLRERLVYAPPIQRESLLRLGISPRAFPSGLNIVPDMSPEFERAASAGITERAREEKHSDGSELNLGDLVEEVFESENEGTRPRGTTTVVGEGHGTGEYWTIWFEDGTEDHVKSDEAVLTLDTAKNAFEPLAPDELRPGHVVVTTNDAISGAKFGRAIISLIARLDSRLAVDIAVDTYWREGIIHYKHSKSCTWQELFSQARAHGYTNETALSIQFYSNRSVWLPIHKSNLEAVLTTIEEARPGISGLTDKAWNAGGKLRRIAGRVLSHIKAEAATSLNPAHLFSGHPNDEDEDPVIVPELGLRSSQIEDVFRVKTVQRVQRPAVARIDFPGV